MKLNKGNLRFPFDPSLKYGIIREPLLVWIIIEPLLVWDYKGTLISMGL